MHRTRNAFVSSVTFLNEATRSGLLIVARHSPLINRVHHKYSAAKKVRSSDAYASRNTSRCPLQASRSGWIRYFLSCRALASPTTCRFIPALSEWPVIRLESVPVIPPMAQSLAVRLYLQRKADAPHQASKARVGAQGVHAGIYFEIGKPFIAHIVRFFEPCERLILFT
jgi:hypothetical protein